MWDACMTYMKIDLWGGFRQENLYSITKWANIVQISGSALSFFVGSDSVVGTYIHTAIRVLYDKCIVNSTEQLKEKFTCAWLETRNWFPFLLKLNLNLN